MACRHPGTLHSSMPRKQSATKKDFTRLSREDGTTSCAMSKGDLIDSNIFNLDRKHDIRLGDHWANQVVGSLK